MLPNKQTKRNLAILLMAAVVVGLTMTAWAKKPDNPGGGKGGKGGGGGGDGGSVGTGTIYYASGGGLWSMNPDGSGKTPLLAGGGDASVALHGGQRWFMQVSEVDGSYPITMFQPEYWNYEWREGDLEAVSFMGDPDPGGAWTISYTIMIDSIGGDGVPDTFSWHAHSSLFGDTPDVTVGDITEDDHELELSINGSMIVLTINFGSTTGHNVNDWWEIYVKKPQRRELFAVSEDGQEVQLTDDPTVQPGSRPEARWATDPYEGVVDGKVSYLAQRWGKDIDGKDVVGERALFAVEIDPEAIPDIDSDGNPTFVPVQPTELPISVPIYDHDWSPEGTWIVYTAPGPVISVADAYKPNDVIPLSGGFGARWSPDGTLIAFVVGSWGDAQIRTISPDGGSPPTTIVAVGKNRIIRGDSIYWSPMGTHLVYTLIQSKACSACQYNDSYNVYRVGADGSNSTNLTNDLKENCFSIGWRD